jgi:hypothetical protein
MSRAVADPKETATVEFVINSNQRLSGSPASCIVQLPRNCPNVKQLEILTFTILNSFYSFVSGLNNILPVTEGATTTHVVIPPGTYDFGVTLASALQTALNAASLTHTYTVTWSTTTLLLTFSATGSFSFNWATAYAAAVPICSQQLGFGRPQDAVNVSSAAVSGVQTIVAPYPAQGYNTNRIGLQWGAFPSHGMATCFTDYTFDIPNDVPFGEVLTYRKGNRTEGALTALNGLQLGRQLQINIIDLISGLVPTPVTEWSLSIAAVPLLGNF